MFKLPLQPFRVEFSVLKPRNSILFFARNCSRQALVPVAITYVFNLHLMDITKNVPAIFNQKILSCYPLAVMEVI